MKTVQLDHGAHRATSIKYPLCYLAHDLDVPMNVGSLFRIADALGVEKIFLTGRSVTPPNQKMKRTSRATEKHVAYEYQEDPLQVVQGLSVLGYKIISLEITSTSIAVDDFSFAHDAKLCLIVGAENGGVCQALLDASDASIHIPMLGHNSSMNLATACAIATYEITRKYRE